MYCVDYIFWELVLSSLYDGGWRSSDTDMLVSEFGFSEIEVSIVCYCLSQYESEE